MRMAVPQFDRVIARVSKPNPPSERQEQTNTINLLRSIGAHVYPIGTTRRKGDYQGTMMAIGLPDIWVILPPLRDGRRPQALWIEMKRQGGRVRPEQKVFAERCQAAGVAHVTGTCDDVIAYLVQGGWLKASSLPHYKQPR